MSALAEPPSWQDVDAYHTPESVSRAERPVDYIDRRPLLDKPSNPHPILSALMDEALRQIGLTADGAAMQLKERVTGSKAGTIAPTSSLAEEIDELGARFVRCRTHRQRLEVIKAAQAAALRLRHAPRNEQRGTVEWKQTIGRDQRACRVVAAVYGVSLRDVVAYRKAYR